VNHYVVTLWRRYYDLFMLVLGAIATGTVVYALGTLPYRSSGSWMFTIGGALAGEVSGVPAASSPL
jgi:hypothetical protein